MKTSLSRRIFLTIFTIGAINVLVTLIAVEYIYEDMEDTILSSELQQERAFLESRIKDQQVHTWHSALLTAVYVPDGGDTSELPDLFARRSVPFSAEVGIGEKSYLISIERTSGRPGVLYLAQDITLLENREDLMQWGIALLCLFMLLLGWLLARHGTQLVVRPLQSLTRAIERIEPGTPINRIEMAYAERELSEIAHTLNHLLTALDAYVKREKSLISLASHELRTPLAVIAGALDVIEQRSALGEADRRTLSRIRLATEEMRSDVDALLKLSRRSSGSEEHSRIDLRACIAQVIAEIQACSPDAHQRIQCSSEADATEIVTDPSLVRMLLRNLVQNAVRHTRHRVQINIQRGRITIADEGTGLPPQIAERLDDATRHQQIPEDGLGLFIVSLICERLGWRLRARHTAPTGTLFELDFGPPGQSHDQQDL